MSFKLVFPFEKTPPRKDFADRVFGEFKTDFGFLTSIPLFARFEKPDGTWTRRIYMVFDTGASISLVPQYIGSELSVQSYVPHELMGIAKRTECTIPVKISQVTMKIEDAYGNVSPEFAVWVAIADRDDVPTVLGMKGVINNFSFESDPLEEKLYMLWKR